MDNTYVKLYRSLLDHDTLSNDNNAYIVFTKLLLKVNRHTGSIRLGRFKLAALTNLKAPTARDALKRLVRDSIVTVATSPNYTDISICNWHEYQNGDDRSDVRLTTEPRSTDVTITRTKNKKKNIITVEGSTVDDLFSFWNETVGVEISSQPVNNRKACGELISTHGVEAVRRFIEGVNKAHSDKYAPRIADFVQLKARLNDLLVWGKQQAKPATVVGGAAKAKAPPGEGMSRKEMLEQEYR